MRLIPKSLRKSVCFHPGRNNPVTACPWDAIGQEPGFPRVNQRARHLAFGATYTGCMIRLSINLRSAPLLLPAAALFCVFVPPPAAHAWGNEGHRMINRLAATALPESVPVFLRTKAAADEIEYLGPEPDRWRSKAESELSAAQAPEMA